MPGDDYNETETCHKVSAFAKDLLAKEAPYLTPVILNFYFRYTSYGAITEVVTGIFGGIDVKKLKASFPAFSAALGVAEISFFIHNHGAKNAPTAINHFAADGAAETPFSPVLVINYSQMDLKMAGLSDPDSLVSQLAEEIDQAYQKLIRRICEYAAETLTSDEFKQGPTLGMGSLKAAS